MKKPKVIYEYKKGDKPKLIYIEWADAVSAPDKWMPENDIGHWIDEGKWWVKHVGFLIEETEDYIVLAAMKMDEHAFSQGFWGHVHKIPKPWIKERREL